MKIRVSFKSPDSVFFAPQGTPKEQRKVFEQLIAEYVEYGEIVHIEFDTDNKTATVVKVH